MIFKKLPKELGEEGISLDLLNNINMDNNYSPVILQVDDEPAKVDEQRGYTTPKTRVKLDQLISEYEKASAMYSAGDYVALLSYLGIMQFTNPMLTVKHDDAKGMAILKNTFGAKALDGWDGDMLNRYAAIEIEKQYPYLIF